MNVAEVFAEVEDELTWRADEMRRLQNVLNLVSSETDGDLVRKSLVVMLYGHLEGFFRAALAIYVNAIDAERLPVGELDEFLAASALADELDCLERGGSSSLLVWGHSPKRASGVAEKELRRVEFVARLGEVMHFSPRLNVERLTDTESNLHANVVKGLFFRLGLRPGDVDAWESLLSRLVALRNSIAHGATRGGVAKPNYDSLARDARIVMEELRSVLFVALRDAAYVRSHPSVSG
jgi:hypothetical protein